MNEWKEWEKRMKEGNKKNYEWKKKKKGWNIYEKRLNERIQKKEWIKKKVNKNIADCRSFDKKCGEKGRKITHWMKE